MIAGDDLHTRRSVGVYSPEEGDAWFRARVNSACTREGFLAGMLSQDIESVIPYRLSGPDFHLELVGDQSEELQNMIGDALRLEFQPSHGLHSSVTHFVRRAAQLLVSCGPLVYEIDFIGGTAEGVRPSRFALELVMPGTFSKRRGKPIQYVPAERASEIDVVRKTRRGRCFVYLDPKAMIEVNVGPQMTRNVARMMAAFQEASRGMEFELTAIRSARAGQGFPEGLSLTARRQRSDKLVAELSAPIGWSARWALRGDREDRLDTYLAWRHMQFVRFEILARESVMDGLNRALLVAGKAVGFSSQLRLAGMTTIDEVDDIQRRFGVGDVSLREIFDLQC